MANLTTQIARHLREVYFGGNWTDVNYKDTLEGVTWQQATSKIQNFNTIAVLVYHTGYYVDVIIKAIQNLPLNAKDEYSFQSPPINSESDWQQLLESNRNKVEVLAGMIEKLPDEKMWEIFVSEKYKIYCRNLMGLIEHFHYHLGQIVLIKKMISDF